jgi:hypothetical protein
MVYTSPSYVPARPARAAAIDSKESIIASNLEHFPRQAHKKLGPASSPLPNSINTG